MRSLRRGGAGVELKYRNFSVIMSSSRRMPMLTAANINGKESRSIPRINAWSFDGRLDKQDQWGDILYCKNGLDRGHMVRREDPVWGIVGENQEGRSRKSLTRKSEVLDLTCTFGVVFYNRGNRAALQ